MTWFKQTFGLDWVEVGIQAVVTGIIAAVVDSSIPGPGGERLILGVVATSFIVFAIRRRLALRRAAKAPVGLSSGEMAAERLDEIDQRLAELESAHSRIAELEERLDFTERLLTSERPELLPRGERHG
jgi:hypothetical protein